MLIGGLLLGAFWTLVIVLAVTGRRLPLSIAALGLIVLLLVALALQPRVHAAGWAALVLTVLVVAVGYALPTWGIGGDADFDGD
jgi:hypothetical protein